jgi:ATP-binding cassette, subfamily B, bacterial MsbA
MLDGFRINDFDLGSVMFFLSENSSSLTLFAVGAIVLGLKIVWSMRCKQKKDKQHSEGIIVYKKLLSYLWPNRGLFFISILGFLVYSSTQPVFAKLIQVIIDALQSSSRDDIVFMPLWFSGLIIVRGIASFVGNYFLARVGTNIVHVLRCQVFNQYSVLPTAYFDENNSGYMMSRITHNVGQVTGAATDAIRTFVREGLTAIGLLAYLFYVNWQLSCIFLFVAPIIALLVGYVSKRMRMLSRRIQDSVGDMTHIVSELINGHRVVRSFGGGNYERQRFLKSSLYNRNQSLKFAVTQSMHNPLMQFIIAIALSIIMYLALGIMKGASAGEFVSYLTAAFLLPRPIRSLSDANASAQRGIAAAIPLFQILSLSKEKDNGEFTQRSWDGRIEFKQVSFRYQDGEDVLTDISFVAESGQTVALVGKSGSGKSTLVNLITRFYDQYEGEILVDGVEVSHYKLNHLRDHIALVTQNTTLFNDTVGNNIAYGSLKDSSEEQVVHAARNAYAMEFIEKLPDGLDTEIGEQGLKLSGGQRQRLAIARAFLKNAPVLILDEATSALDTNSEKLVQKALNELTGERTTIVIAHRLSTIQNADVILVMDQGRIVEQGNHQELIAKNGVYTKLHAMNFEQH